MYRRLGPVIFAGFWILAYLGWTPLPNPLIAARPESSWPRRSPREPHSGSATCCRLPEPGPAHRGRARPVLPSDRDRPTGSPSSGWMVSRDRFRGPRATATAQLGGPAPARRHFAPPTPSRSKPQRVCRGRPAGAPRCRALPGSPFRAPRRALGSASGDTSPEESAPEGRWQAAPWRPGSRGLAGASVDGPPSRSWTTSLIPALPPQDGAARACPAVPCSDRPRNANIRLHHRCRGRLAAIRFPGRPGNAHLTQAPLPSNQPPACPGGTGGSLPRTRGPATADPEKKKRKKKWRAQRPPSRSSGRRIEHGSGGPCRASAREPSSHHGEGGRASLDRFPAPVKERAQ